MKSRILFIIIFLLGIIVSSTETANSQVNENEETVEVTAVENSTLRIEGTSTLQDWDAEAEEINVSFLIPENWLYDSANWNGEEVEHLEVFVPVEHLETGRSRMNRDLRDALQFEDHNEIHFIWDDFKFENSDDEAKTAKVTGTLTIAGISRDISFSADIFLNVEGQIETTGRIGINMTDYEIDRPTAFLGVLRTGEEVDVIFNLFLDRKN